MRHVHTNRFATILFVLTIIGGFSSCFGNKQKAADDEVQAADEQAAAAPAVQPAAQPTAEPTVPAVVPAPEPATDTASAAQPKKADASAEEPIAPSAGTVWYVKGNNTKIYDQAGDKAKAIGKRDKGDHVLIKSVQGEWIETADGLFMKVKGLTYKPVGRPLSPGEWTK